MTSAPITVGDAIEVAVSCFRDADYVNVVQVCDEILRAEPANVSALHLRGLAHANCGNLPQAITDISTALLTRPEDFELLNNLGNLHKSANNLADAIECYERCLRSEPQCHPAKFNLANVLFEIGEYERAEATYREAIELQPKFAEAHYNLGLVLRRTGRHEDALQEFRKCIANNTDHVQAQIEIGNCLVSLGRTAEAMNAFKVASLVDPNAAETFNNLGVLHTQQGNYVEAKAVLESAVRLNPNFDAARNNLGVVRYLLGELEDAAEEFSEVISANPENAQSYRNLAKCLADMGAYDDAIVTYRTSLRYQPGASDVLAELGAVYAKAGYSKQATETFDQLANQRPDSFIPHLGRAVASLRKFYESKEAQAESLSTFEQLMDECEKHLNLRTAEAIDEAVYALAMLQPHHLIYVPEDNRDRLAKFGAIAHRIMSKKYPHWSEPIPMPPRNPDGKLRVGLVGCGDVTTITMLDKSAFHVIPYATRGTSFERLCESIIADKLHVLIIPELRTDSVALQLASLRLAPIQCVTWQNAQTTGLPTVDYFLSGELLESRDSESAYSEKLVRLPNLGCYIETITPPLVQNDNDIYVDGIELSDFNQTLNSISSGKPVIAHDGSLMRTKVAAGLLKQIDVTETIASDSDQLGELCARMKQDSEWRHSLAARMKDRLHFAFRDQEAVDGLARFLQSAVPAK